MGLGFRASLGLTVRVLGLSISRVPGGTGHSFVSGVGSALTLPPRPSPTQTSKTCPTPNSWNLISKPEKTETRNLDHSECKKPELSPTLFLRVPIRPIVNTSTFG